MGSVWEQFLCNSSLQSKPKCSRDNEFRQGNVAIERRIKCNVDRIIFIMSSSVKDYLSEVG